MLTAAEIYRLARGAGFDESSAATATAIALAESKGDPNAVGDVALQTAKWGPSIGLWQIRSLNADKGTGRTRDASRLTDPAFNAASAFTIYKERGNWTAWSVYNSGAYTRYIPDAKAAASAAKDQPASGIVGALQDVAQIPDTLAGIGPAIQRATDNVVVVLMIIFLVVVGVYLIFRGGKVREDARTVTGLAVGKVRAAKAAQEAIA